jgi:hypothetical protein
MAATSDVKWDQQSRKEVEEFGALKVLHRDTDDARSSLIVNSARSGLQGMSKGDLKVRRDDLRATGQSTETAECAQNYSEVCKKMVDELQQEVEGAWHCIVGESFGERLSGCWPLCRTPLNLTQPLTGCFMAQETNSYVASCGPGLVCTHTRHRRLMYFSLGKVCFAVYKHG